MSEKRSVEERLRPIHARLHVVKKVFDDLTIDLSDEELAEGAEIGLEETIDELDELRVALPKKVMLLEVADDGRDER